MDEVESGKIRTNIEGEAVVGDPAPHRHADRGDLLFSDPDAGASCNLPALDAPAGQSVGEPELELAEEAMQVVTVGVEVADRVADELPRAVPGDVAAAGDLEQLDAAPRELVGRDLEAAL